MAGGSGEAKAALFPRQEDAIASQDTSNIWIFIPKPRGLGRGGGFQLTWEGRGSSGFVSASAEQAPGAEAAGKADPEPTGTSPAATPPSPVNGVPRAWVAPSCPHPASPAPPEPAARAGGRPGAAVQRLHRGMPGFWAASPPPPPPPPPLPPLLLPTQL